jgi:two-component system capsular synthesis sensor histidine kinase RcsC
MGAGICPVDAIAGREDAEPTGAPPRPRVLVVEDNPYVRTMLCDLLAALGCATDSAIDGMQGVERLERADFALVITDLSMPGLSGWEVAEAVRRRPATGLILVTAAATAGTRERAEAAGLALLPKPFSFDELRAAVRRALGNARPRPRELF